MLYDNGSAVPAARPPAGLAAAGLLTVIDFPRREAPQLSAYYHCLCQWKTHSRWLAFIDIDEFVLPLARRDVRDLLEACEAWAGLAARWMVFGSGGHLRSYINGVCLRHHVKSLVRPQWASSLCRRTTLPVRRGVFASTRTAFRTGSLFLSRGGKNPHQSLFLYITAGY